MWVWADTYGTVWFLQWLEMQLHLLSSYLDPIASSTVRPPRWNRHCDLLIILCLKIYFCILSWLTCSKSTSIDVYLVSANFALTQFLLCSGLWKELSMNPLSQGFVWELILLWKLIRKKSYMSLLTHTHIAIWRHWNFKEKNPKTGEVKLSLLSVSHLAASVYRVPSSWARSKNYIAVDIIINSKYISTRSDVHRIQVQNNKHCSCRNISNPPRKLDSWPDKQRRCSKGKSV